MVVNGRHNLSSLLAIGCDINFSWLHFSWLHYRHLVEGVAPTAVDFKEGIYWVDILRDLGYSTGYLRAERYSPAQYLRPYVGPRAFAILDWRDLRPFMKRSGYLAKQVCTRLFTRKKADA